MHRVSADEVIACRDSNDDIDIREYQRGRIMMSKVTFDYSKADGFVQEHEMQYMSELAAQAKDKLLAKTGAGNDFLGSSGRL